MSARTRRIGNTLNNITLKIFNKSELQLYHSVHICKNQKIPYNDDLQTHSAVAGIMFEKGLGLKKKK